MKLLEKLFGKRDLPRLQLTYYRYVGKIEITYWDNEIEVKPFDFMTVVRITTEKQMLSAVRPWDPKKPMRGFKVLSFQHLETITI